MSSSHIAFIRIQQALELDTTLDCTEKECDQLFDAIRPLINKPYDPDTGWTLLHLASAHGNTTFAQRLVACGAHINLQTSDRKTAYFLLPDFAGDLRDFFVSRGAVTDPAYFANNDPEFKSSPLINANFGRKLGVVFIAPFVYLLLSSGIIFGLQFIACSLLFYFVAAAYFTASLTRRPVWYNYDPEAKSLPMRNLPENWRGAFHDPKVHFNYDFEDVTFTSNHPNNKKYLLKGWYVAGSKNDGVPRREMALVFTHGGGRDRRSWLRHLPIFVEQGYTCLLYDLSEHGLSSGTGLGLSYGIRERFDVKSAAEYMKLKRGWKRIAAIGTSVGAAATISGAALGKDVIDVVIAENPMLTCSQLQSVLMHRVMGPLFRGTWISKRLFSAFKKLSSMFLNLQLGNVPSQKCQPMHTVSQISPRPLLLLHGTHDETVPAAHGQKLFDLAQEPKEMWLLPEAMHCTLYDQAPEEFKKRVLGFLERFGKPSAALPQSVSSAALVSNRAASSSSKQQPSAAAARFASSDVSGMFSPSTAKELLGTDTFVDDNTPASPIDLSDALQQQKQQQHSNKGKTQQAKHPQPAPKQPAPQPPAKNNGSKKKK